MGRWVSTGPAWSPGPGWGRAGLGAQECLPWLAGSAARAAARTPRGIPSPRLFDRLVMRPLAYVRVARSLRPNRYQFEEKVIQGSDVGLCLLAERPRLEASTNGLLSL